MFNLKTATAVAVALSITATSAFAEKVLRSQSVLSNASNEALIL